MTRTVISAALKRTDFGTDVNIKGWVRTRRGNKNVSFIALNDGSTIHNIQVVVDNEKFGEEYLKPITTGACISVTGKLTESLGKGQTVEVHADKIEIYGTADPETYPLQKKGHTLEFLREIAHLRPRTNTFGAIFRIRHHMSMAIHSFFHERGFFYFHTPIITGSDCEGAGQMFQVTTMPLDKVPFSKNENGNSVDYTKDFFGKKAHLTVSGQLEGELFASALGNCYTFGPTFRAEHSNTTRHLAEFWMIEPEMAFCDIYGNMDVAEEFLKYIFRYVLDNCGTDMDFFEKWVCPGVKQNLVSIIESKFERITYTEAIEQLLKADVVFDYPVKWGMDLQSEHEKYITEKVFNKPVIVTGYPKEIKAFYMKLNDDGKTVRAMDILFPRLGEIIGGSERESDYDKLVGRIESLGLNKEDYWWYLDLRRFGSVPHSGFGLGFERAVQFVTGMQNIRDVIPFPRTFRSAEF